MPAQRVIQSLERLIEWQGKPKTTRCTYSIAHRDWTQAIAIELVCIHLGKQTQNADFCVKKVE